MYAAEESKVADYDASYEYAVNGKTVSADAFRLVGTTAQAGTVKVTNTLAAADLSVTKKVDGNAANTSKEYSFTITKKDDSSLSGDYGTDGNGNKVTFAEGTASFTLKHGQTLDLKGLPKGEYTVSENGLDKTTTKVTTQLDDGAATEQTINGDSASVTVTVGDTKSVTFTNTSELKPAARGPAGHLRRRHRGPRRLCPEALARLVWQARCVEGVSHVSPRTSRPRRSRFRSSS